MRSQAPGWRRMSEPGHGERALPNAWRQEHWSPNGTGRTFAGETRSVQHAAAPQVVQTRYAKPIPRLLLSSHVSASYRAARLDASPDNSSEFSTGPPVYLPLQVRPSHSVSNIV